MKTAQFAAVSFLLVALAACADGAVTLPQTATPSQAGTALFDGIGLGSGGFVANDSTTSTTTTTTTCTPLDGGIGLGSGGRTDECP